MNEPTIEQIKAWLRSLPGSMSAWSERDERMVGIIHRLIEQRPKVTIGFIEKLTTKIEFRAPQARHDFIKAILIGGFKDSGIKIQAEVGDEEEK